MRTFLQLALLTSSSFTSVAFCPSSSVRVHSTWLRATEQPLAEVSGAANEEYAAWELEERQAQMEDMLEKAKSDFSAEGEGDGVNLPDYMLRMINDMEDDGHFFEDLAPGIAAEELPTIAIIGRPNTGKSTIVNRLTNSFKDGSIVHDEPGITRDATYKVGEWDGYKFQVVDTGGIIFEDTEDIFAERITFQALTALRTAQVAVLVTDGQLGPTAMDLELANWLRKNNKVTAQRRPCAHAPTHPVCRVYQ